jgi:hypothetical protein
MKIHPASLLPLAALLVSATAFGQGASLTIADFPRYGAELNRGQREELRLVAARIARALQAGGSVEVSVTGHADFDAKGRDFETQVSRERASGGEAALKSLVQEEGAKVGLAPARLTAVRYTSTGLGTARPVFSPAVNEEQRRANRRVEFALAATAPPPQAQESPFQRCVRVLAGTGPAGPARRMTCACNKLLQSPRALDSHYDFQARQQLPGLATLTPQQMTVAIESIVLRLRPQVASSANGADDRNFVVGLQSLDDAIGRNINDFASQENAGAATSIFDRLVTADIRGRMGDPNHIYSCYAGYSRANHDR